MAELSNQQDAFCHEYILDFNATQAAIRAKYSEKTARSQANRLLTNVDIQKRIAELVEERNNRVQIDADYVLRRLVEIDQMDALDILNEDGSLKPVGKWPKIWRQFISGMDLSEVTVGDDINVIVKKIKWPDKVKNLELLGRHTSVGAFKDKQQQQLVELEIEKLKAEIGIGDKGISTEPEYTLSPDEVGPESPIL